MLYVFIALGGAIGSVLRYWLSTILDTRLNAAFPWGTLCVNVTGCIAIGLFANLTGTDGRHVGSLESRFFFMTGVCGGYTTFSSFSLQTLSLVREGDSLRAAAYVLSSVLLCLLGVWLGHQAANLINQSHAG
jgi:fluoride exporter